MKLKKLLLPFFFISFAFVWAQEPISESNSFMYNKQNYGFDFFNIASCQAFPDGSINTFPYNAISLTISNTYARQTFKNGKNNVNEIIYFKNRTFTRNGESIYEVLKGQFLKKIYTVKPNENLTSWIVSKNLIYFVTTDVSNKNINYYTFDGFSFRILFQKKFSYKFDASLYLTDNDKASVYMSVNDTSKGSFTLYRIEGNTLVKARVYPFNPIHINFLSLDEFYFEDKNNIIWYYSNGKTSKVCTTKNNAYSLSIHYQVINSYEKNNLYLLKLKKEKLDTLANLSNVSGSYNHLHNKETNSYYVGTGTNFYRLFPFIKKYPKIFNNSNSQQIFSIIQAEDGRIWAGSYNGALSVVDKRKIFQSDFNTMVMNGGIRVGKKILINGEGGRGVFLFDSEKEFRKINDSIICFYNFLSKDSVLYCGTSSWGVMYAKWKDVASGKKINWKFIGTKQGNLLKNSLCIVEDKFGNIWSSQRGFCIYQPYKNKSVTWSKEKNEIGFSSKSMWVDDHKTLWTGSYNGKLFYYSGKNRDDLSPKNFKPISHPLLDCNKEITFLHQWQGYLILGASDKILLFDLQKWYKEKKVFIRYLNTMETNFSAPTEQNVALTDFRDHSVWFSTSDMLYQWNIKDWLKLPTFNVIPKIAFKKDSTEVYVEKDKSISFKPRENTLDFDIRYQTIDNMPRYISVCLVKEDENPVFAVPNLETHFKFANLRSGKYIFYVRVCQQNGSFNIYQYKIKIENFFWQNWWFWLIILLFVFSVIYYYFDIRRKIEQQQKEIAQLNLVSLGKQFRPHFMLNALNSLGSDMRDKPHAERIISRIGENINIMHKFAKDSHIDIDFEHEWKLTLNTIDIQKEIFIKDLKTSIFNREIIPNDYRLPMGIIQVNVENALLHGIRHRKAPPYDLEIRFSEDSDYFIVEITDNGVGMEKSQTFYDFNKNGTGISNLKSVLEIINNNIPGTLSVKMENASVTETENPGTTVTIMMKKNISYEKFKI